MRSDFWGLPYAARQAIRRGESDARAARRRAWTISELEAENTQLRSLLCEARDVIRKTGGGDAILNAIDEVTK